MKAVILLGCDGRQDNGFIFCRGVNNVVLSLDKRQYAEYIQRALTEGRRDLDRQSGCRPCVLLGSYHI